MAQNHPIGAPLGRRACGASDGGVKLGQRLEHLAAALAAMHRGMTA